VPDWVSRRNISSSSSNTFEKSVIIYSMAERPAKRSDNGRFSDAALDASDCKRNVGHGLAGSYLLL